MTLIECFSRTGLIAVLQLKTATYGATMSEQTTIADIIIIVCDILAIIFIIVNM